MLERYTPVEAEKLAKKPGSFAMGTVLRIGAWRVLIYTQITVHHMSMWCLARGERKSC